MATPDDPLRRWRVSDLRELVPGTSRTLWYRWAPRLIAAGALRKAGRFWVGRQSAIEAAILELNRG